MRRPVLDYDPDRCAYLLDKLQRAIPKAQSCGLRAVQFALVGHEYEARRRARLAARYGMDWREAWLEHNERVEGIRRKSAAVCFGGH